MSDPLRPVDPTVRVITRRRTPVGPQAMVAVVLTVLAMVAAAAWAGREPSAPLDPEAVLVAGASASAAAPAATGGASQKPDKLKVRDFVRGGQGRHAITITSISGNQVALTTDDGWRRTVTVTSDTTIRKGGAEATVSDLAVGDRVALRQRKNDDGTYTVTALVVPQPVVGGAVTAVTTTAITIEQRDGSRMTVHVGAATTFHARRGANVGIGDVKVGDRIRAVGNLRADGSLDATAVQIRGKGGPQDRGSRRDAPKASPSASPAPTESS